MVLPPGCHFGKGKCLFHSTMERELVNKTASQVEIIRLENEKYNYKILWGNPLTGDRDGGIFANSVKINGYAFATSGMEMGEYGKEIEIRQYERGGSCNIVLPD